MINRDNKIEILEKEIEKIQNETKTNEVKIKQNIKIKNFILKLKF